MKCTIADASDLVAGYAFKSKDFGDFEDKVIKITHITPPTVDMQNLSAVNMKEYDKSKLSKYIAKEGDYVLAMTGATIGKIGRIENGRALINQRVLLFKPKDIVDKDFLYYILTQKSFSKYVINHIDSESAQPNISAGTIGKYEFEVPNIEMQRKIGGILRNIDKKIEQNRRINDNLEEQASALINDYFSSTAETVELGKIMSFENGFAFQSKTYLSSGRYRIITIKNVQDGKIDAQGAAYIDEVPLRMKSGCFLSIGDVLLSLTGNVGRVGIVYEDNLLLNQRVAKFIPADANILPWLYYYFRQTSTKISLETIAKGTAQQNLSPIETLKLCAPFEMESAKRLTEVLRPMFNHEIANSIESLHLAELRDSLLPRLMTGEIDVSDIEL